MNLFLIFIFFVVSKNIYASDCKELVKSEMKRGGLSPEARLTHSDIFDNKTNPDVLSNLQGKFSEIESTFRNELYDIEIANINATENLTEQEKRNRISNIYDGRTPEGGALLQKAYSKARGTEVGRMISKATQNIDSKIAPFEVVYRNAGRYGVGFDKVSVYGTDPNVVRVFTKNDRPVALQSFTNANGLKIQKISFIGEDCKVNKFIEEFYTKDGGSFFEYYSRQVCTPEALSTLRSLSAEVGKIENDPLYEANEFRFRCQEQGGNYVNICRCTNGKFINEDFESCYKERRPKSITAKNKLENFLTEKETITWAPSSRDYERVKLACEYYGGDVVADQKKSSVRERIYWPKGVPANQ